jgi:hypothetical protein
VAPWDLVELDRRRLKALAKAHESFGVVRYRALIQIDFSVGHDEGPRVPIARFHEAYRRASAVRCALPEVEVIRGESRCGPPADHGRSEARLASTRGWERQEPTACRCSVGNSWAISRCAL